MNVGDLVKIATEATQPKKGLFVGENIGIIIHEMETSWVHIDEGEPIDSAFPELFFNVYNFSEKAVLVYNSFEMKVLNKAPSETSNRKEEF
jgi:hypothetical protein